MWTDVFVRRPVFAVVVSLVFVLLGLVALPRLGVRETPQVDAPTVTVSTVWFGADPAIVESEVTEVLEREVNGIEGLRLIRSESRSQVSQITLEFALERDLEAAANDVRDRVSRARSRLPDDVEDPVVEKADADAQPMMYLRLVGDRSLLELSDIADRLVRERLQNVPGVSSVQFSGERRYAMRVELDLERMAARGITVADLRAAFAAQNVQAPAGRVEGEVTDLGARLAAGLVTPEDFDRMVIAVRDGAEIRLGDVAFVRLGAEDERSAARSDGVPAVSLQVIPQSGASIVAISDEIQARLPAIEAALPEGVGLEISHDRSIPVRHGIRDVVFTLGLAVVAVVLIIAAFLRSLRATLIPTVAIVVSIVGTFVFLEAFDFTINVFTLFGLVLAIGIVVDDAIVVLENVWKKIEAGRTPYDAAIEGTREIVFPVVATTLSLLAVFLPVIFAGGTSGRLFLEFGATLAVSVAISGVVALTLTPMMCGWFLTAPPQAAHAEGEGPMERAFDRTLGPVFARPWLSAAVVLASLGVGAWSLTTVPREFFPIEDRNFFLVRATGPEGVGFAWMDARMAEVEQLVMEAVPERRNIMTRVGGGRGTTPGAANTGSFGVVLPPAEERTRTQGEIVAALRPLLDQVTAFRAIPIQFPTVGRGRGSPVEVAVLYDDAETLLADAPKILATAQAVPGLSGVDLDLKLDRPEVIVEVDREKAAALGVSLREIASTLQLLSTGLEMSRFEMRSRQYDVIVGLGPDDRATPEQLGRVNVRTADGALVPLSNLVRFVERSAPSSRYHVDRAPAATVSANLDGIALGEGVERLRTALREALGPSVRFELLGQSREMAEAEGTLTLVFGLAVALVFLVLAAQFDSFRDPFPILVSLPVAVAAGVGGLMASGEPLSFFAQVGLVLLVGLVTKNGILIVEFARQAEAAEGLGPWEAARKAARLRLRPILMTALSTVGGAVPIALGFSGASRSSLGIVVVAGMTAATVLSLYVTPVMWAALASVRLGRARTAAAAALLLLVPLSGRAEVLDLADALALAERQSPAVRAARAEAEAARRGVDVARGRLLPTVGTTGRYQYGNSFVAGGRGVGGEPTPFASVAATLGVPLVDAPAIGAFRASRRQAEAAAASADEAALDALRDVGLAFVDVQAAEARLAVARDTVARSRELLEVAEARVRVGVAIPLDATRARVTVRQDELAVVQAERDVAAARALLAALVDAEVAAVAPLAVLPAPEQLEAERPDVAAAEARLEAARADVLSARLAFVPRLGAFGSAGAQSRFDDGWTPTLAAGLELAWTPLDLAAVSEIGRRGTVRLAAAARLDATTAAARAELATAAADLRSAAEGLALADEALALAEAELAQAVARYETGAEDNVAVVQAQIRRAELALARVDAVAAWDRAVVRWYAAHGTLAPLR